MDEITLTVQTRTDLGSAHAGRMRRDGVVPAVIYGLGTDTQSIQLNAHELQVALNGKAGANALITLRNGSDESLTLARQIQRHPVRHTLVHVDFIRVSRDVAVDADVPLSIVGEAPGVKLGGLLEQLIFSFPISAKPADIPTMIEVDVSGLGLGDQLHISDVVFPPGVIANQEPHELVMQVSAPRGLLASEGEGEGAEGEQATPTAGGAPSAGDSEG